MLVIDVDVKNGNGCDDMKMLIERLGELPSSPFAITGSGGYHLFFKRPNAPLLGSKKITVFGRKTEIDIQVGNQYIVAPPSINGSGIAYRFGLPLGSVETLPELPQAWIDAFPQKGKQECVPRTIDGAPVQQPTSFANIYNAEAAHSVVEHCRQYLSCMEPAVQGSNGHRQLLRVCNAIFFGFGLDKVQGWPLLEEFNARCEPPWDLSDQAEFNEFNRKAEQALRYQSSKHERGYLAEKGLQHAEPISDSELSELLENHQKQLQGTINVIEDIPKQASLNAPPTIPVEMLYCPGFVGESIDFCRESAPVYTSGAAFCGALAMQSFLCGRKVRSITDLRTNLYLVALAGSSSGKDHPRKLNTKILHAINQLDNLGDKFVSGEGIQDMLASRMNVLFQSDEFDSIFRNIALGKEVYTNNLMATLLTMYTSSNSFYPVRKRSGNVDLPAIDQPHLTIFGTAPPDSYYQSFNGQMLQGGLFARLMIFDSSDRVRNKRPKALTEMPQRLIDTAKWWCKCHPVMQQGNMAAFSPVPQVIDQTDEATHVLDEWLDYTDYEWRSAKADGDESTCSVWGRANENAIKLAMLYAASENAQYPMISESGAKWAISLVDALVRRQLYFADTYAAKNQFDAYCKEALRILAKWHEKKGAMELIPKWVFKRKFRIDPRTFEETLKELEAQKKIIFEVRQKEGACKPNIGYRLT